MRFPSSPFLKVLETEIGKLKAVFSHHLREYEVTLSQLQSSNHNGPDAKENSLDLYST